MSNYLAVKIFQALGAKTSKLSPLCKRLLDLDRRRLIGDDDNRKAFPFNVQWEAGSFIKQMDQSIENEKNIMSQGERLKETFDRMMLAMTVILDRLDIDPSILDNPNSNDTKSKKSKKAKQAKPKVPKESDEGDRLFTRNLLEEAVNDKFDMMERQVKSMEGKIESIDVKVGSVESQGNSIEGKVKSMEGKVESIEGKVESIEGKVESIEGKVESIEKTMEELKDMLSQLMLRGADVA